MKTIRYILTALLPVLVLPAGTAATQAHVPSEGLYVHQMAHFFFALSMGFLIYWLRERQLVKDRGWRLIQLSALFFMLWNLDAILAHFLDGRSDLFRTIDEGTWHASIQLNPETQFLAMVYYVSKMDHMLCVPAMVLLFMGLRSLWRQAGTRTDHQNSLP